MFGPPPTTRQDSSDGRLFRGWLVAFALVGVALGCAAVESALHFDTYAMDGPFQLFNALRRISAGQRIGDTFQFFHGPGIPYLFFPVFALSGGTFVAAEVTRQLLTVALFLGSTLVLSRAFAGDWRRALPLATIAVVVFQWFRLDALTYPLNSLLGVRATMPLFIAAHLLMRAPSRRASLERGLLLGLALLLGSEQGMASFAALALTRALMGLRVRDWRGEAVRFSTEAGTAVLTFLVVIGLLAGSHMGSVLRFNFRDVPMDQLWYFGAPPNPFLSQWSEILPEMAQRPRWWLTFIAALVIAGMAWWRSRRSDDLRRPTTQVFLILYGTISLTSMLGIFVLAYAQPAARAATFIVLGWAYAEWDRCRDRIPDDRAWLRRAVPVGALALAVLVSFAREPRAMTAISRAPVHVIRDHVIGGEPARMSEPWINTQLTALSEFEKLRRSLGHTPTIWSTYAGLIEWQLGVFHPATDYIIHALGPRRRAEYAAKFVAARPDLVQTVRPSFIFYEEWLEGAHWDFYRPLLDQYDVAATGPWSFFWTRRGGPPLPPGQVVFDMAAPPGARMISTDPKLPTDSVALYEIRLRYHTRNPLGFIPVLGGQPRYLIDMVGSANRYPVSLAPYATERSFPVVIRGGTPITLRARVASLIGGASITLDSVRIERIPVSRVNGIWMRDYLNRNPLER